MDYDDNFNKANEKTMDGPIFMQGIQGNQRDTCPDCEKASSCSSRRASLSSALLDYGSGIG